jgi:glutamyl-tRNA synthetase
MSETSQKVITRFAPSPTGFMHVGGLRTGLFAWLWARKNSGTFILRIEDTDKGREISGSKEHIMESLSWLGLSWDFGPDRPGPWGSCVQSERLDVYKKYAQKLIAKGLAYPDPYTEEEVENFRKKAEENKQPFLFRNHRPETFDAWDGAKPLRFKVPELKRYEWHDEVRGVLSAGIEALDDFILIKADGYPTYNFCHVVDDIEMGVTHVMRGEEFIASTPKFLSLYDALEARPPIFATLPPILGESGTKKLSKRDGAKDVLEYKKEGYVPDAMVNFLAFVGWNPGGEKEVYQRQELIETFSLDRIQKSGARFNPEKLEWMNKEHIKLLSTEEVYEKMLSYFSDENLSQTSLKRIKKLLPIAYDRMNTYSDFYRDFKEGEYSYVVEKPSFDIQKIIWKQDTLENAQKHLQEVKTILSSIPEDLWNIENIKHGVWEYAEKVGRGNVLWPLRYSLSGKEKSPDPFTLAFVLGKEETLLRI